MTVAISKNQARELALFIYSDIADYVNANQDKYEAWLRTQTDNECMAELRAIEKLKQNINDNKAVSNA